MKHENTNWKTKCRPNDTCLQSNHKDRGWVHTLWMWSTHALYIKMPFNLYLSTGGILGLKMEGSVFYSESCSAHMDIVRPQSQQTHVHSEPRSRSSDRGILPVKGAFWIRPSGNLKLIRAKGQLWSSTWLYMVVVVLHSRQYMVHSGYFPWGGSGLVGAGLIWPENYSLDQKNCPRKIGILL